MQVLQQRSEMENDACNETRFSTCLHRQRRLQTSNRRTEPECRSQPAVGQIEQTASNDFDEENSLSESFLSMAVYVRHQHGELCFVSAVLSCKKHVPMAKLETCGAENNHRAAALFTDPLFVL